MAHVPQQKKERAEAVPEGDAEMVARSKITSEGCGGAGTPMSGIATEEEELDELYAGESA
jgi:hypothetical protein